MEKLNRRNFAGGLLAAGAVPLLGTGSGLAAARSYRGPNVIVVRFGGGVRRRETIDPVHTYSPYLRFELAKRGVLYTDMRIAELKDVNTSHGEGTINILTGRYNAYRDVSDHFLQEKFEASVPTLFEYLRKAYAVPSHQALLVNGEDRPSEEYYTHGNHRMFGVAYRSEVLSLNRYKTWLLRQKLKSGQGTDEEIAAMTEELAIREAEDRHKIERNGQGPEIEKFWARWRRHYGDTGLKNPRGDRLLTTLALRALKELRPKLLMINYQDPDYVHWGNASHYTRAISIIDQEIQRLVEYTSRAPAYSGRTVFVITPDCGRDSNPLMKVPFQHHFNSRAAHETWALLTGPGIVRGKIITKPVDQSALASTIGGIMGFSTPHAERNPLVEAFV